MRQLSQYTEVAFEKLGCGALSAGPDATLSLAACNLKCGTVLTLGHDSNRVVSVVDKKVTGSVSSFTGPAGKQLGEGLQAAFSAEFNATVPTEAVMALRKAKATCLSATPGPSDAAVAASPENDPEPMWRSSGVFFKVQAPLPVFALNSLCLP